MPRYGDTYDANPYAYGESAVAYSPAAEKAAFIQRTYGHLAGAILAFVGIEVALFQTGFAKDILTSLFTSRGSYLMLMLLFIGGSYAAVALANSARSMAMQYAGLALYVLLEVVIFLPLLYIAQERFPGQHLPEKAGIITLLTFAGLTAGVFLSGKDFSFLGPILGVLAFAALGVIIASYLFGFTLGIVFPAAMVVLAAGFIVYDTSNVMHRYHSGQHVAASLALFASIAMLFYYILRIFMSSRD